MIFITLLYKAVFIVLKKGFIYLIFNIFNIKELLILKNIHYSNKHK